MKIINLEGLIRGDDPNGKCYLCNKAHTKYKLVSHYLTVNKDREAAFIDFINFNDDFVNGDRYRNCKKYCDSWIKAFKKYVRYDE